MTSIFETCTTTLPASANTTDLIKCVSEQEEALRVSLANGVDSFWLIYAGALVFFMQAGFAMLCAGSVRAKSVKHVILWNLLDSAGGGLAFWATGYAFAYGGDTTEKNWTFVGNKNFFLQPIEDIRMENFLFQWAFACALSSIVAGTIAERTQMKAYLIYSFFLVSFVYPVVRTMIAIFC
jgi:Amt family ammonium transporter